MPMHTPVGTGLLSPMPPPTPMSVYSPGVEIHFGVQVAQPAPSAPASFASPFGNYSLGGNAAPQHHDPNPVRFDQSAFSFNRKGGHRAGR